MFLEKSLNPLMRDQPEKTSSSALMKGEISFSLAVFHQPLTD